MLPAATAPPACRELSVPVVLRGERALVAVSLDGRAARMVLDTGASSTILLADAPQRLGLALDNAHPAEQSMSYGRTFELKFARVQALGFAGEMSDVADVPVAAGGWLQDGVDGFFTDARLQQADFDFARGEVRLSCPGAEPPAWTREHGVSALPLEKRYRLFTTALVNGVPVRVMFDSGSPGSSMTLAAATRAGVPVGGAPNVGVSGLGATSTLRAWTTTLPRLQLGDEVIEQAPMLVVDKPNASADMLAGFDFFLTHRIFVDKAAGRLMARPNGGRWLAAPIGKATSPAPRPPGD